MVSSGMLCRVALARTDVSEERSISFIRVTRIGEPGTTLAVTSNRRPLRINTKRDSVRRLLVRASAVPSSPILVTMVETLRSSETSVLTRATRRNIPEDAILYSHRRENLVVLLKIYHGMRTEHLFSLGVVPLLSSSLPLHECSLQSLQSVCSSATV
jgi:hypothetical protein